ncbi:hypothetical protein B9N43_01605 [Denitratisoma sp. DHT3]|uniref:class I SAM-dependent methyltransferase n=1 Tax=Denitratisoma sp. DHT3 TaxID=1981880 RepID=UPI001198AE7E|nr:class I SAM-dependent methyltransferase [Denitratisoma sp. DHT3]QDX80062.1 hypothetical protein B9N43_01605 [Denitratisoma sp. DHT3]
MNNIEPPRIEASSELTGKIRDFWSRRVNAERVFGKTVSRHGRGEDAYFRDLETQRYRSHRHLKPWIERMQSGRSVLEIGCGVGLDTYTMARQGLNVTAADLTHVGVATAQARFRREGLPGVFLVGDACGLPLAAESFDYIYSFGVLHHAADTSRSIDEVFRLLKPGGIALIMLYHRRSLNEWVHRLLGVPFEEKDELCPVVRRYTMAEAKVLFARFRSVEIKPDFLFGEGYGVLFRLIPLPIYRWLSRRIGWHLMIAAVK